MPARYLLVKVDTNDGDYIEKLTPIPATDQILLVPLFDVIKAFVPYRVEVNGIAWEQHHNFPYGEVHRPDLGEKSINELYPDHTEALETFCDTYLPYNEFGCHTIKSIRLLTIEVDTKLLG